MVKECHNSVPFDTHTPPPRIDLSRQKKSIAARISQTHPTIWVR